MASRLSVEAPGTQSVVGGLLSVANVIDSDDPHFAQGVTYEADPYGVAHVAPNFCYSAISVAEEEKEFDAPEHIEGDPFAVYRGFECDLGRWDSYASRAAALLALGESHGVEDGLRQVVLDGTDKVVVSTGVTDVVHAVALLEEYAGEHYSALPTLHVGKYGATHLLRRGLAKWEDDHFVTSQRSLLAVGTGYGRGEGVTAGSKSYWVWATGRVNLWRGRVMATRAADLKFNKAAGLAERIYAPAVEGFVAGVLVEEETP